jgi:hypothetical protein
VTPPDQHTRLLGEYQSNYETRDESSIFDLSSYFQEKRAERDEAFCSCNKYLAELMAEDVPVSKASIVCVENNDPAGAYEFWALIDSFVQSHVVEMHLSPGFNTLKLPYT